MTEGSGGKRPPQTQGGAARIATPPPTPAQRAREALQRTGEFRQQAPAAESPQGTVLSISAELLQKAESFLGVPSASIRLAKKADRENAYDINLRGRTVGEYHVDEGRILIRYDAAGREARDRVQIPRFIETLVGEGRAVILFEITEFAIAAGAFDNTGRKQFTMQLR